MDFETMMTLEGHGPDTYVGAGPKYPWGGLYGGQIVAQALRAAALTVPDGHRVHSLHAYFIRLGDHEQPIRFEVDRVRDGRSFSTRQVVARQSAGAILGMSASFQADEEAPEAQTAVLRELPTPESLPSTPWSSLLDRRFVPTEEEPGRAIAWLRMTGEIGDDPLVHACAFAYLSDDLPTDAVVTQHPNRPAPGSAEYPFWSASLDHAIWFHRPFRADEWHVHDFTCHGLIGSRGLSVGNIFTADGRHVATVAQEVLLRLRRT